MTDASHSSLVGRIRSWGPGAIVLSGILLGQAILFGPSLVGAKILLPLELLRWQNSYLPAASRAAELVPGDPTAFDLIVSNEPARRFSVGELRAGRWPTWTPYQFGGSPFAFPAYSPFWILKSAVASPVVLGWAQVLLALVAGLGAYLFFRRTLGVGFWPATLAAWCFPLTGFFALWVGYPMTGCVAWFPWILLGIHRAVTRPSGWSAVVVATTTGLGLTGGQLDVAGQVLLVSGMYALWCVANEHHGRWLGRTALRSLSVVAVGWALGFLLAAPYLLPLLEYSQTGSRMARREVGAEERPPVGLAALPQAVLPDMYGSTQPGAFPMFPKGQGNQRESSAAAYSGLLATLLAAPLAWCSRRHRSINIFWLFLGLLGLAWLLGIPGVVSVLRLPGLNMMSHNRLVFAASFAVLALAAVGLDALMRGETRRRNWFHLPAAILMVLGAWCLYRAAVPPEPLASDLQRALEAGRTVPWVGDLAQLRLVQSNFSRCYWIASVLCGAGFAGWLTVGSRSRAPRWFVPAVGAAMVADLLWFAHGRAAQSDPALYFPRLPVLEHVSRAGPGRIIGYETLPATLSEMHDLRDIRGYDGVDPVRWVDLVMIGADPTSPRHPYALTQVLAPTVYLKPPGEFRLHPVLDLLNVRHVVFRGLPPPEIQPVFAANDYWALANENVLPRAFVPERVETITDDAERLRRMGRPEFDPRTVAFVESPSGRVERSRGSAAILEETPTRIVVRAEMQTPGLVVLTDRWDAGWKARLDGRPVPILRVDHALRGVEAPSGPSTLEFRYEPSSRTWGLRSSALALLVLAGWVGIDRARARGARVA